MNDSFRTNAFVRFHPETIACACIYLAARQLGIALPTSPPWFDIFLVEEDDIRDVAISILKLYQRKKPDFEKLEGKVNELKKVHIEAKLKMKGGLASDIGTPNSGSRQNTPSKNSPTPHGNPALKKLKDEDVRSDRSFGDGVYNNGAKKRHSPDSPHRDRGRSISGSPRSRKSGSYTSRSGSRGSRSPSPDKRRHSPKRSKKSSGYKDHYSNKSRKHQRQSRKRRHTRSHSRSRSRTPSRERSPIYASSRLAKKTYKDRRRSASQSYSRSPSVSPVRRNTSKSHKKSYYKEKHRSRSRSRSYERVKSKKHNGHHRSYSGERYRR